MAIMQKIILASIMLALSVGYAEAKSHHYRHHRHYRHVVSGSRPSAWCGWFMRRIVGKDPGTAFNLARNWSHWGSATSPHVGAIVVWPHHVGKIVGGSPGHWAVLSGNDGHAVRTRERSIAGAIAFRE